MASEGIFTTTPLELILGTYATSASAIATTASAGTAKTVSRGDHVHSIALATGDSNGQVKIAGSNVSVKGLGSNAYTSTAYLPLTGGTLSGNLNLSAGSVNAQKGNIIAGTYAANTAQSGEYRVEAQSGAGRLYIYSQAAVTANRGLYGVNAAGTAQSFITIDQSNNATFYGTLSGNASTATSATKATQDGNGATISSTYLKLSGGTMTGAITFARTATGNFILVTQNGTTSGYWRIGTLGPAGTEGWCDLTLGNATASSAANNASCRVYLYNSSGAHSNIRGTHSTIAGTERDAITAGYLVTTQVTGALWNDYAECRKVETLERGRCVCEDGDTMKLSYKRLQAGAKITSDTFGMLIGETEEAKTPIAVSGRVLAFPYEKRNKTKFKPGRAVCSAPGGTIDVMSRLECILFPDRIIGTVSEIPDYEIWEAGTKDDITEIKVNGRIWIYVK